MSDPTRGAESEPSRFVLPEFTRSLRGFASVRALGTREHELLFGPLVAARRSAMRVLAPEAKAAAFDAEKMRRTLLEAIGAIAAERGGADASLVRAYAARLEERAATAFAGLAGLATAAATLRAAQPGNRLAAWDAWCRAVHALFAATDLLWLALDEVAPRRSRE